MPTIWKSSEDNQLSRFGLEQFRPGQVDVIQSVMEGDDCLCVMPTGGGKSLCYQYPAVVRPGLVMVVSPLIALMKDQVDGLQELGIQAACINSSQTIDQQGEILRQTANGELDLLYVAPERLRSPRFLQTISDIEIQLLAIDEAHCISQWGHDFRPDYARLGNLRRKIGKPQTIALTATATDDVRKDILKQLELDECQVFVNGFARENLFLEVAAPVNIQDKNQRLTTFLHANPGAGIIYASTRKKCEEIVELLNRGSRKFGFYHGGMLPEDRKSVQERFMDGDVDVIIATNAFGMGIDKSDIRFVVHYNLPGTLEAYYQEAGRAGRDGNPSNCLLLFSQGDRFIQEFFIENAYPSPKSVEQVYQYLRSQSKDPVELTLGDLKNELNLSLAADGVGVCEQLLEKAGAIERLDTQDNLASVKLTGNLPSLVDMLPKEAKTQRRVLVEIEKLIGDQRNERLFFHPRQLVNAELELESIQRAIRQLNEKPFFDYIPPFRGRAVHVVDRSKNFSDWPIDFAGMNERKAMEFSKLQTIVDFAMSRRCRQCEILEYFGDSNSKPCHCCDNCRPTASLVPSLALPSHCHQAVCQCVRMALSGIARSRGRFGKSLVCQMLWGSKSAKVRKVGLEKLSTFGLLSFLNQSEIEALVESILAVHYAEQSEKKRFRPLINITESGISLMKGNLDLPENFPLKSELATKILFHLPSAADSAPKDLKNRLGGSELKIPESSPLENENHIRIDAADPLEMETRSLQNQLVKMEVKPTSGLSGAKQSNSAQKGKKDWEWTLELVQLGFEIPEILTIRNFDDHQFFNHLIEAIQNSPPSKLPSILGLVKRTCGCPDDLRPLSVEHFPKIFQASAAGFFEKYQESIDSIR